MKARHDQDVGVFWTKAAFEVVALRASQWSQMKARHNRILGFFKSKALTFKLVYLKEIWFRRSRMKAQHSTERQIAFKTGT